MKSKRKQGGTIRNRIDRLFAVGVSIVVVVVVVVGVVSGQQECLSQRIDGILRVQRFVCEEANRGCNGIFDFTHLVTTLPETMAKKQTIQLQ